MTHAIVVADAYLLFNGDFRRSGPDLVIAKDDRQVIIDDYFRNEKRAALASRDGATLSGDVVHALVGEQYAQATAPVSPGIVIGKVSKTTGSTTVVRGGVSIQLNMGDNVYKGDVVQTGSASSLGIVFIDGTVFGLASNARMLLNEMIYDPAGSSNSSLLTLVQGTITFVAGETAKRGDMRVETPAATMGIRGTAVLVEIDFVVPGSGVVPPVRVQLLVEPGGVTGSLQLYSRSSPTTVIGQASQAGVVTSITGAGDVSTQAATPLSLETRAIVEQTLREFYPGFNPRLSPNGSSTPPPEGPDNGLSPDPINFEVGPAMLLRIRYELPGLRSVEDFIPDVTRVNTPPNVNVNDVVVIVGQNGSGFTIGERTSIIDPDATNSFHDVPIPYLPGTAVLLDATAPPGGPASTASLIAIDTETGAVHYDPASFAFLPSGAQARYIIGFDSQSGPHIVHRTLTFTIIGVNDAPVVTSAVLAVAEGNSVILTAADIGVSDPDNSSFTFTVLQVTHGQFEIFSGGAWTPTTTFTSADIAAGHVRFTHDGGEVQPTFAIQAFDGIDASNVFTGTFDFAPVNDAPVAFADTNRAQQELQPVIDGNVILGADHAGFADVADTDVDNETLTVNAVNGSAGNIGQAVIGQYGTLTLNADGSYSYIVNNEAVRGLDTGESVVDEFTYTVTDGAATSNVSTLTITVFGNNDKPVAVADTNQAQEDVLATIGGNVIAGASHGAFADVADTDVDDEALTVNAVNGIADNVGQAITGQYGTLTLNGDGSYTYVVNNAAIQGLDTDEIVTDPFTYTVTDGTATSNVTTLTITIFGNNDKPVALADTNWAKEDLRTLVDGNVIAGGSHGAFADVADTDVDDEPLTVNAVNGAAGNVGQSVCGQYGTLTLKADGSYCYVVDKYAIQGLDTDETVTDRFTYTVTDGTATSNVTTLTITIFGNNDKPVALADTNWAKEDLRTLVDGNVIAGGSHGAFADVADTDADGETLTVNAVNGAAGNVGQSVCGQYGTLTLKADGSYCYVVDKYAIQRLDTDETVTDQFTYTVTDGTATSNVTTLTITIFGNNDKPVALADTNWAKEDLRTLVDGNVIAGASHGAFADVADTDADGETLTVNAVNGAAGNVGQSVCGQYGTLTLKADGSYCYVVDKYAIQGLDTDETVTDQFTYTVTDGTATSNVTTLTITIFGNNDKPVALADTNWAKEDLRTLVDGNVIAGASHGAFADVADTDADGETLTVNVVNGAAGNVGHSVCGQYGTLTLKADGSYCYVVDRYAIQGLDTDETVTDQFTYTVTDGTATSNVTTLTITIFGNNDKPVALADTNWAKEDLRTLVDGNVIAGASHGAFADVADTDADGDTLTVNAVNGAAGNVGHSICGQYGTLTLKADGSYCYVVDNGAIQGLGAGETVADQFTYTVTDGAATSNATTLTITIFGNNDKPVVVNTENWMSSDTAQLEADAPLYANGYPILVGIPTDVDGDNLTVRASGPIPAGVFYYDDSCLVPLTDGTLLYDSSTALNRLDDLVYRPTECSTDVLNASFSLQVSDGISYQNQTVGLHEVVHGQYAINNASGIIVNGTARADQIYGTSRDDTLAGGNGNDILEARGGSNLLLGGAGDDNFRFVTDCGHSVIGDFTPGSDRIDLSAIVATDNLSQWIATHASQSPNGTDTLLTVSGDLTITLCNVLPNGLSTSDFIVHATGNSA